MLYYAALYFTIYYSILCYCKILFVISYLRERIEGFDVVHVNSCSDSSDLRAPC